MVSLKKKKKNIQKMEKEWPVVRILSHQEGLKDVGALVNTKREGNGKYGSFPRVPEDIFL